MNTKPKPSAKQSVKKNEVIHIDKEEDSYVKDYVSFN